MGKILYPPAGFDLALARETAALAAGAYAQLAQVNWQIDPAYDLLKVLQAKPVGWLAVDERFGFIARSRVSGDVFVTFRGTQSPEDWLCNLTFPQVKHPWGMAEEGFSALYSQCAQDVKDIVAAAAPQRVIVTGHSLGGALATLATADLAIAGTPALMYNFASPRTGNRDFADRFNQLVNSPWRIVNTEDLVTTVPLASIELEYVKADMLHTIAALAEHLGNNLDFQHVGTPVCFSTHNQSVIGNHAIETYIAALG